MSNLVCVAQIVNVHGIKGAVKMKPFLRDVGLLRALGKLTDREEIRSFDIGTVSQKKEHVIVQLRGITTRNEAETLKGLFLYADRNAFPKNGENEFYYTDLIGLTVLKDGKNFGVVQRVDNFGAGDILDVKLLNGKSCSFSFSQKTFPQVDLEKKEIELVLPEGLEAFVYED